MKKKKIFFHSQKDTIVSQLHVYIRIGYKQDKNRHTERERKSKRMASRVHFDFTLQVFV